MTRVALRNGLLLVATWLLTVWALPAHADSLALTLNEVLLAVDRAHPELEAALEDVEAARAKQLSAKGGWDPVLEVEAEWVPEGYYQRRRADAEVRQATPFWGIELEAGYRISKGDFPPYKGEYETLSAGELRAGASVPLWKDGPIDAQRRDLALSDARAAASECARRTTRLRLQQAAAVRYFEWWARGQELLIQRQLLKVAEERNKGLSEQAKLGLIPNLTLIDNERLVLDRSSKLVEAERRFGDAGLRLSLYLRDASLAPVAPEEHRLPVEPTPVAARSLASGRDAVAQALATRPEFCALERELEAARVQVAFTENQLAPSVRVHAGASRDLGSGDADLASTEFAVGVSLEMPIGLRDARGKHRAASAAVRKLEAKLRSLTDSVSTDVRRMQLNVDAAKRQFALAERQAAVAAQLAELERERFAQGATDLVIVNLRELAAADAARLVVDAKGAYEAAKAQYLTTLGNEL